MYRIKLIILFLLPVICFGQSKTVNGTYSNGQFGKKETFNSLVAKSPITITTGGGTDTISFAGSSTVNASAQKIAIGQSSTTLTYSNLFFDTLKYWHGINTTSPLGITDVYPTFLGTVATTSGSPTVTGTSTRFQDLFKNGDSILISATYYNVLSIASQTSMTLTGNAGATASGLSYSNPSTARGVWMLRENGTVWQYGLPFIRNNLLYRNLTLGTQALAALTTGTGNIAFGYQSLFKNTTGSGNTGIGSVTLYENTTGAQNVGIGYATLASNQTGDNNTGIGYAVLLGANASGNTGIGYSALNQTTSGANNTAIGFSAMYSNSTGGTNTAIGAEAGRQNTTGIRNTSVGFEALMQINTGNSNTGIGYLAGAYLGDYVTTNQTTSNSIYIGHGTTASVNGANNEAVIGYNVGANGNNTITFGSYTKMYLGAIIWATGTGDPNSAVTAPVGSFYSRTDGGAGTSWYVKESGTGNTGWVAK